MHEKSILNFIKESDAKLMFHAYWRYFQKCSQFLKKYLQYA